MAPDLKILGSFKSLIEAYEAEIIGTNLKIINQENGIDYHECMSL